MNRRLIVNCVFIAALVCAVNACASIEKARPMKDGGRAVGPVGPETYKTSPFKGKEDRIDEAQKTLDKRAKALYGSQLSDETLEVANIDLKASFFSATAKGTAVAYPNEEPVAETPAEAVPAQASPLLPALAGGQHPTPPPAASASPRPITAPAAGGEDQHYIFFEPYTTNVSDEALSIPELVNVSSTLNDVLKILQENPDYRLLIEGFANPVTGSKAENEELMRLSVQRAKETESRFVRDGIARSRFITVGEGGLTNSADKSKTQQAKNRRVQMTVIRPQTDRSFKIPFAATYTTLTSRDFFAQDQISSLEKIRAVVDYIKANPNCRLLIQGFEAPSERRGNRNRASPVGKQRADEVARVLRRELQHEGIAFPKMIAVDGTTLQESAVEIMFLPSLTASIP